MECLKASFPSCVLTLQLTAGQETALGSSPEALEGVLNSCSVTSAPKAATLPWVCVFSETRGLAEI